MAHTTNTPTSQTVGPDNMLRVFLFLALLSGICSISSVDPSTIKHVDIVLMNHLDVGFSTPDGKVAYTPNVVNVYFHTYFPNAIRIANQLKNNASTTARLVYTTHPWLVALYLDCDASGFPFLPQLQTHIQCPSALEVQQFEKAIIRGIIRWHAFPFNAQSELYDESLFQAGAVMHHRERLTSVGLDVAKRLSDRFNISQPQTMSQKDVPGLTRGVVPILKRNNVKAIHVGVNGASAPPAFDDGVNVWRDTDSGEEIYLLFHKGDYGGKELQDAVLVPGFDRALIVYVRSDNSGPGSAAEENFKNAVVSAGSYDDYIEKLDEFVTGERREGKNVSINTYTQEIGDTWIYGVPSDPYKIAVFRAIMRVRKSNIERGVWNTSDPDLIRADLMLLKIGEHTWGLDVKTYLKDFDNWSNEDFDKVRYGNNYQILINSWLDQRSYLDATIALLTNHSIIYNQIKKEIGELKTKKPTGLGWKKIENPLEQMWISKFSIGFGEDGSINHLLDTVSGKTYADLSHPLGSFVYNTYDNSDYDEYLTQYPYIPGAWWLPGDFGKPNVTAGKPTHNKDKPKLVNIYKKGNQLWLRSKLRSDSHTEAGAPSEIFTTISVGGNKTHGTIYFRVQWFDKRPTRLPEALWFGFNPRAQENTTGWKIEKLGSVISPRDVVLNGSHHLHGSVKGVSLDSLSVESSDAAILSPGKATPFPIPLDSVSDLGGKGISFCLANNIWGTNYVMWYPFLTEDDESVFRFKPSRIINPSPLVADSSKKGSRGMALRNDSYRSCGDKMRIKTPQISWHGRDPIYSIHLHPSGRIATAGTDKDVKFVTLQQHVSSFWKRWWADLVCLMLRVDTDRFIYVWEKKEGASQTIRGNLDADDEVENKEVWVVKYALRGHTADIYDLAWSPNSNYMISASTDNTVILWDTKKKEMMEILEGHQHYVQGCTWDPLSRMIITQSADRTARIYQLHVDRLTNYKSNGKPGKEHIATIRHVIKDKEDRGNAGETKHKRKMFCDENLNTFFRRPAWSPDGSIFLIPAGIEEASEGEPSNCVYIYSSLAPNQPIAELHGLPSPAISVHFNPKLYQLEGTCPYGLSHTLVYAVLTLNGVAIYRTTTSNPIAYIDNIHYSGLTDATWCGEGKHLLISSKDGYVTWVCFKEGELGVVIAGDSSSCDPPSSSLVTETMQE
ncbi:hypothetical protein PROFUN_13257 [Planoprotostelium fungivorum]|uniref:CAF1B/HIR1 beta-propeller domain-containing protein n=1 Tax=Planoprotostelium fungivorum TaxID=1890364 RepID=A0A2P6N4Z1_9EUKA|nr:hypothetical protein PROFUN_13257 [Planoprotostelium fungivorum]